MVEERPSPRTVMDPSYHLTRFRHLMQSSSGVDRFSFGPSFWQAHDDDEWKSPKDSDNPSYHRHSLPAQEYHNVTKRRGCGKETKKSGRSR